MNKTDIVLAKLAKQLNREEKDLHIHYRNEETGFVVVQCSVGGSLFFCVGSEKGYLETVTYYGREAMIQYKGFEEDDEKVVYKAVGCITIHFGILCRFEDIVFEKKKIVKYGKKCPLLNFF